ncbi:M56 family metallopeptidase [Robiginitalea sp. SC105]|uniref:M56 family metallopeptidase n=1 Tax=Robiginitalea sp. SC105 TaxID=2762332 RepID=UPI00163A8156|nr:M56 family metallopeptidase [Robiginitalea sp. SC105]MBC2839871.1 M56 family peptidase [Robiginitalea sp. SC105]
MEAFGIYILKASAILALFLGAYHLLLKRETLFAVNRLFLASGLVAALVLPLVRLTRTVQVSMVQTAPGVPVSILSPGETATGFPWETLLLAAYALGVLVSLVLVIRQLWRLLGLIRHADPVRRDGFCYIPTPHTRAPFSFFRYIFYNPAQHGQEELELILEHERAHGQELHTLDILLGRLVAAVLWINPLSRWYQRSMEQNLEYLADARAVQRIHNLKDYQYTLLKVSGNTPVAGLVNAFYSSLIKKRIHMLHQNQSKTIHILKHLLILPVLGLFLMAFNTETRYMFEESPADLIFPADDKTVELTIDKDTSDEELAKIKSDLAGDAIDFSYTVVRNDKREIIDLEISMSGTNSEGKSFSGSFHTETDSPIEPVLIRFDDTNNSVSFGNAKSLHSGGAYSYTIKKMGAGERDANRTQTVEIRRVGDEDNHIFWKSDGDAEAQTIEVKEINGKQVVIVDGEVTEEVEVGKLHESGDGKHKVKIHTLRKSDAGDNIVIIRDSDDDADIEVISGEDGEGFFFIDSGDGEEPLYYIDGKKASAKEVKKLDPKKIDKMEVLKGDKATKEYGKKAKDGVVKITTKD